MDPGADKVVHAFRGLGPAARTEALNALVDELTAAEWRRVQARLNDRTFQLDFVRRLPLELVLQVFSHLDIAAPCRLQVVSKQWHHVLSSPNFLNQKLREWDRVPDGATADFVANPALRLSKAKQVHRFRTGRPFTSCLSSFSLDNKWDFPSKSVLIGDTFAWITAARGAVRACNLRTGKTWTGLDTARESIISITGSEEFLVFATYKVCYVQNLLDNTRKQFRLPNAHGGSIYCRGRIVTYLDSLYTSTPSSWSGKKLYIWNFDSSRGHSIDISTGSSTPVAVLPNGESKTVTVFFCKTPTSGPPGLPCSMDYNIYTFQGTLLRRCTNPLTGLVYGRDHVHYGYSRAYPVDSQACFAFELGNLDTHQTLLFNENTGEFVEARLPGCTGIGNGDNVEWLPHVALWKGIYYKVDSRGTIWTGTNSDTRRTRLATGRNALSYAMEEGESVISSGCHANETFVVVYVKRGAQTALEIFCFEEGLDFFKGNLDLDAF